MTDLKWKRVGEVIYAGIKPYKGRIKWVSMKTGDMATARRKAEEAKLFKLQAVESANALTAAVVSSLMGKEIPQVSDAIDRFILALTQAARPAEAIGKMRTTLLQWMRGAGVGKKLVSEIKPTHFLAFFNPCGGSKLKTLEQRQYRCGKFFDYCAEQGWTNGANPAKGCGIDKTKLTQEEKLTTSHKPVTREEVDKLLAWAAQMPNPFWYFAILIGWEHGLRFGDICNMEKVNIVDNQLRLKTGKTGTVVQMPLTETIVQAVNRLSPPEAEHEAQFLFPRERSAYNLWGAGYFTPQFKKICKVQGVEGKTFHGLRTAYINRTFVEKQDSIIKAMASELAKQQTAANAGHKSTAATDIYLAAGGAPSASGR